MREMLLITIEGQPYGIWKEEILSIAEIKTLHRLPLSPQCIAGLSIIDNRTVTLADLPVCIGHGPAPASGKGRILLLAGNEKITGFVVSGNIDFLSVNNNAVISMPHYLFTEVIGSCAVHNTVPIPIINVLKLAEQLLKAGQEPARGAISISDPRPIDSMNISSVRVFGLAEEFYALPSFCTDDESIKPGPIARLSLVPEYVKGVTVVDGSLVPVIDLLQRIKRQKIDGDCRMILAEISGEKFGLLVNEDRGSRHDVKMLGLPRIAQSSWLSAAVIEDGQIVPLIDPVSLLSAWDIEPRQKALEQFFTPDSQFDSQFRKHDVDVLEFSLLGARHAVPKCEVEDVVGFKPYRAIPDIPEIVIGVADFAGKLLPVLDLAMVFGRRSLVTPEWRMLLLKNGDFRALVITEQVFGERRLEQGIQREVPIILPHRVVYGCYPDSDAVRLILNVEAIAVYFEKSLVKELLPALSKEMKQAPAEVVHALLEETEGASACEALKYTEFSSEALPAATGITEKTRVPFENITGPPIHIEGPLETRHEEQERMQPEIVEQMAEGRPAASVSQPEEKKERGTLLPVLETSDASAPAGPAVIEQPDTTTEYKDQVSSEKESITVPDKKIEDMTGEAEEAPIAQTASCVVDRAGQTEVKERTVEETLTGSAPVETGLTSDAPERVQASLTYTQQEPVADSQPTYEPGSEPAAQSEREPAAQPRPEPEPISETPTVTIDTNIFSEEKVPEAVQASAAGAPELNRMQDVEQAVAETSTHQDAISAPPPSVWKRRTVYGAIAAVLLAVLLYFVVISGKPGIEKPLKETASAKIEPVNGFKGQVPEEKTAVPLVLEVPVNKPVDSEVYIVIHGDTLWNISERFTGNPFNYPRIAGENRIADPDLIFPGQKIRLKRR